MLVYPVAEDKPRFLRVKHDWSPVELFELFFDDEVISLMATNSERYAGEQKGDHSFGMTDENVISSLAIMLPSG